MEGEDSQGGERVLMPKNADGTLARIDPARCTGCGMCVAACPAGSVAVVDGKARVESETCTGCGLCEEACPEAAIQLVRRSERMPAPQGRASDIRRRKPLAADGGAAYRSSVVGPLVRPWPWRGAALQIALARGGMNTGWGTRRRRRGRGP